MTEKYYLILTVYWIISFLSTVIYFGVNWDDYAKYLSDFLTPEFIEKFMKPYMIIWSMIVGMFLFPLLVKTLILSIKIKFLNRKRENTVEKLVNDIKDVSVSKQEGLNNKN